MTDMLPRLDVAFDAVASRSLDRRQLLRAGAWAAPALVLATAAPAAANTSGVDFSGSAMAIYSLQAGNESAVGFLRGSSKIGYDGQAFGDYPVQAPLVMNVTWRTVLMQNGVVLSTFLNRTDSLQRGGESPEVPFSANGLAPGTYLVRTEFVSATFAPNPMQQGYGASKQMAYFSANYSKKDLTVTVL